jgi:hypothetical protein
MRWHPGPSRFAASPLKKVTECGQRLKTVADVRHQRFRDSEQGKLREALAHLVDDVTRLAVGVASDVL